jgi:tetratricopeptide (TPR) repeat protein
VALISTIFTILLFFLGLCYLYYPSLVIKINKWAKDKLFNDEFILMYRKKVGIICIVVSLLIFYFGVFIPKLSLSFRQQNIRDDLYHAWCYYYQKNYDKAENLCREILFVQPDNPIVKEQLALIYFAKGDYRKSIYYCKRVLEENPNNKRIEKIFNSIKDRAIKK